MDLKSPPAYPEVPTISVMCFALIQKGQIFSSPLDSLLGLPLVSTSQVWSLNSKLERERCAWAGEKETIDKPCLHNIKCKRFEHFWFQHKKSCSVRSADPTLASVKNIKCQQDAEQALCMNNARTVNYVNHRGKEKIKIKSISVCNIQS